MNKAILWDLGIFSFYQEVVFDKDRSKESLYETKECFLCL